MLRVGDRRGTSLAKPDLAPNGRWGGETVPQNKSYSTNQNKLRGVGVPSWFWKTVRKGVNLSKMFAR